MYLRAAIAKRFLISHGLDSSHCEGISAIIFTKFLPVFNEHIKIKFSKVCYLIWLDFHGNDIYANTDTQATALKHEVSVVKLLSI